MKNIIKEMSNPNNNNNLIYMRFWKMIRNVQQNIHN